MVAIDDQAFGMRIEVFQGKPHGQKGCLQNVGPIDFGSIHDADADGYGYPVNLVIETVSRCRSEFLAVRNSLEPSLCRQHHGCSNDRPCKRASSCLVDPGDDRKPPFPKGLFRIPETGGLHQKSRFSLIRAAFPLRLRK